MTGGRKRGSVRRKGWLHRTRHHNAEPPLAPTDTLGEAEVAPDTTASLDQVLRRAAEARKPEPED